MTRKSLNKTITAVLLSGSLFLANAGLANAEEVVDLTLNNSIQMAMENNRTIKQSYYDTDSARWALKEARGQKGLTISWQGSAAALQKEQALWHRAQKRGPVFPPGGPDGDRRQGASGDCKGHGGNGQDILLPGGRPGEAAQ